MSSFAPASINIREKKTSILRGVAYDVAVRKCWSDMSQNNAPDFDVNAECMRVNTEALASADEATSRLLRSLHQAQAGQGNNANLSYDEAWLFIYLFLLLVRL